MRRWPDTLPTPSEPGFSLAPVTQVIRTDMEVGAARLRRITFARNDTASMAWVFTDAEMAAFRAWFEDAAWSLAGDSDSLAGWTLIGATITAGALVGPDDVLADQIVEDSGTSLHHAQLPVVAVASSVVSYCVTLKSAGRTMARIGLIDRSGAVLLYTEVDLATGTLGAQSGLASRSIKDRGNGWWRVTITANCATGASDPNVRIAALSGPSVGTYAGAGAAALSVCEINSRVATGYDLFVRTDASGNALGAAGGSAWATVPMAVGGGFSYVEARFKGTFKASASAGLRWNVSAEMEVRNA